MQTYAVVKGDTLSSLSARFGVPLDALVRVNGKQQNPNLIQEGEKLRIPRSSGKYDEMIASFEGLLRHADHDHVERMQELNAIEREGATFASRIDLAADLATCFVGMGKAILSYGGVVRSAALRKETFNAAQKVMVHAIDDPTTGSGKVVLKAGGAATADQYLRALEQVGTVDGTQFAKKFGKDAAKSGTKLIAKHLIKSHIAVDKQLGTEIVVGMAVQVAMTGLKKASDVAGLVSPSNVAQYYVAKHSGEDLRTSLSRSRQNVDASYQRIRGMLMARISAARAERKEVYNI